MKRKRPLLLLSMLALPLCFLSSPVLAGGEVNFLFGQKDLDLELDPADQGLSPLEDQTGFAVLFTFGKDWPVSLAVDILTTDESVSASYSYTYYGYSYTFTGSIDAETLGEQGSRLRGGRPSLDQR